MHFIGFYTGIEYYWTNLLSEHSGFVPSLGTTLLLSTKNTEFNSSHVQITSPLFDNYFVTPSLTLSGHYFLNDRVSLVLSENYRYTYSIDQATNDYDIGYRSNEFTTQIGFQVFSQLEWTISFNRMIKQQIKKGPPTRSLLFSSPINPYAHQG